VLVRHEAPVTGARLLSNGRVLSWSSDCSLQHCDIDGEGQAFYFDSEPTVVLPLTPSQFFVGDRHGRIHVLEVVEAAPQ
jgi:hypothetical protein